VKITFLKSSETKTLLGQFQVSTTKAKEVIQLI
jgi:hypothetical protein